MSTGTSSRTHTTSTAQKYFPALPTNRSVIIECQSIQVILDHEVFLMDYQSSARCLD